MAKKKADLHSIYSDIDELLVEKTRFRSLNQLTRDDLNAVLEKLGIQQIDISLYMGKPKYYFSNTVNGGRMKLRHIHAVKNYAKENMGPRAFEEALLAVEIENQEKNISKKQDINVYQLLREKAVLERIVFKKDELISSLENEINRLENSEDK